MTAEDLDLRQESLDAALPLADAIEVFRKRYISEILERNGGNRTKTAKDLDVDPRTIFRHLEKLESERRAGPAPAGKPRRRRTVRPGSPASPRSSSPSSPAARCSAAAHPAAPARRGLHRRRAAHHAPADPHHERRTRRLAMTDYGPRASCPPGSAFQISATLIDENSEEPVEVRWFVDYDPNNQVQRTPLQVQTLPPPADPQQFKRFPSPFPFAPWDFDRPDERVHVVELTISNGFLPVGAAVPPGTSPTAPRPPATRSRSSAGPSRPSATGGCGP